jgi:predicted CXXCH cytochrome family protein
MISRIERWLIALVFALLAAGVTLVVASAHEEERPVPQGFVQDCAACHKESQSNWENGAHGRSEVVKCETCHGAPSENHPKTSMPVNQSPELCIGCHSNSNFGVQDWKASKHQQLGIDCATCHDPHSTSLKTATDPAANHVNDASALCTNCHTDHSTNFAFSIHSQQGVSCVDCHVNPAKKADGTTGTTTNHTFQADLASCNSCHADQMHSSTDAKSPAGTNGSVEPTVEVAHAAITSEPEPVSPLGFSALAGLIGLSGGMVLAPWLERWYRRALKTEREEDNE